MRSKKEYRRSVWAWHVGMISGLIVWMPWRLIRSIWKPGEVWAEIRRAMVRTSEYTMEEKFD